MTTPTPPATPVPPSTPATDDFARTTRKLRFTALGVVGVVLQLMD
ncbi:hypothetical protein [Streptomyces sp. NPDC012756]